MVGWYSLCSEPNPIVLNYLLPIHLSSVQSLSRVRLFEIPWTVVCQAPLSMEFSSEEYWSGLPSPSPGDLPDPGLKPKSPALQGNSFLSEPPGKPQPQLLTK